MTRHERRLFREAAAMGYVLGDRAQHSRHGDDFPHDQDIVANVIEHCDADRDTFPYTAALCTGRRRRITRKRLHPGEDNHR
jgi:hypothetical protein